jgi:hypothetical protein
MVPVVGCIVDSLNRLVRPPGTALSKLGSFINQYHLPSSMATFLQRDTKARKANHKALQRCCGKLNRHLAFTRPHKRHRRRSPQWGGETWGFALSAQPKRSASLLCISLASIRSSCGRIVSCFPCIRANLRRIAMNQIPCRCIKHPQHVHAGDQEQIHIRCRVIDRIPG